MLHRRNVGTYYWQLHDFTYANLSKFKKGVCLFDITRQQKGPLL